jgi:sensor histidine kinase regulating citrate/malate metabolism
MARNKQMILIFVMAIALVITVGYITMDTFQRMQFQEQNAAFEQGAIFGYQQGVLQLLQQASTCQPVPVTADNFTLNLVATECLQQIEQPAEADS